jgi:threonine dehydrogenase-like Zn-dependent dehydrogenase
MSGSETSQLMPALTFEMKIWKLIKSKLRGMRKPSGYWKPGGAVELKQLPVPSLVSDDWVIVKTALSGICGSDMKEVTLSGAIDNPLRGFITFPQIMGHEATGIIDKVGSKVKKVKVGDRVAISPWLPCAPRGITPECPRCQQGDFTHCKNFQRGKLPTGMHLGIATGFGGYAPYIAVHESQCFKIPNGIDFESAVLADPFSVAFHSCLLLDPNPESVILVYGIGIIGLLTVLCLKNLFKVKHVVGVGRYQNQKDMALSLGAKHVFTSSGGKLIEEVAEYTNAELYTPSKGPKWCMDGVDGIIDTIASASTLEASFRFLTTQGRLVLTGVSKPERCENTPHYFKEMELIGSNSFSIENFEGKEKHAFEFFLEFLKEKRIDVSPLVTHKFPLKQYRDAFNALADKKESNAIKVVFDFT